MRTRVMTGGSRVTLLDLAVVDAPTPPPLPLPADMAEAAGFPRGAMAFGVGVELERVRTGLIAGSQLPDDWDPPAEPDPGKMATECGWEGESRARAACVAGVLAERNRVLRATNDPTIGSPP